MYMCLVSDFQRCTTLTVSLTNDFLFAALSLTVLVQFQNVMKTEGLPADPVERAVQKMLNAERNYIKVLTIMEEMMTEPLSKILTTHEQSIIFYGIKVFFQSKPRNLNPS